MDIFKWLKIPGGEKVEVKAYKTWTVRWTSRHGPYSSDTSPEVEVFTTKEDAERFATELRTAFRLTRHSSGTEVSVSSNQ